MNPKKFKLEASQIVKLINPMGGCYSTDQITVDGFKVGYMYRESPDFEGDSGWRFFSGFETQDYMDNPDNLAIYDVNTIANYDPSIIPYLELEEGAELERAEGSDKFIEVTE